MATPANDTGFDPLPSGASVSAAYPAHRGHPAATDDEDFADLVNCCQHSVSLFPETGTTPIFVLAAGTPDTIVRLSTADQITLKRRDNDGFKFVAPPKFNGLDTKLTPQPGKRYVVSALAAKFMRKHCREFDGNEIFAPESNKLAVFQDGRVAGCRALVCYEAKKRHPEEDDVSCKRQKE